MTQVIKKRRIVLASLLKPVDDTRMLEKIGASLAQVESFEISIIGYPTTAELKVKNITFLPLKHFHRLSLGRLKASLEVLIKIHQVKPEVIIINTPELLWVAIINKILFGRKIIYDVLENYYRNIRYTETYSRWIRLPLALLTRLIEKLSAPFIDYYFLAEKGYENEFGFASPKLILENKLPQSIAESLVQEAPVTRIVFSGTIAPTTGVIEAIELAEELHAIDQNYTLTIIGYCADSKFLEKVKGLVNDKPFITLIGGNRLVPHHQILEEISKSGAGIAVYKVNPSTINSIPTKLYEYLALRKIILLRHNEESQKMVARLGAGLVLDKTPNYMEIDKRLKSGHFLRRTEPNLYWESQNEVLFQCIEKLKIYS